MDTKKRCGINDIMGGGIFMCNREVSPDGNGSYCAYHGKQDVRNLDLQLTPKAWFKAWFYYFPKSLWYKMKKFHTVMDYWWTTRSNPRCYVKDCKSKSCMKMVINGQWQPVCLDHCDWY